MPLDFLTGGKIQLKKLIFFLIKMASEPELLMFLAQTFQYVAVGGFISVIFEGNDTPVEVIGADWLPSRPTLFSIGIFICGIVMLMLAIAYRNRKEDKK